MREGIVICEVEMGAERVVKGFRGERGGEWESAGSDRWGGTGHE